MTDQQLKNIAIGFVNVLRCQDGAYADWKALPHVDKYAEFADLVQGMFNLAEKPTNAEVDKIKAFIKGELKPEVDKLNQIRPNAEVECCMICFSAPA